MLPWEYDHFTDYRGALLILQPHAAPGRPAHRRARGAYLPCLRGGVRGYRSGAAHDARAAVAEAACTDPPRAGLARAMPVSVLVWVTRSDDHERIEQHQCMSPES
jgi:hypothetical protein